MAQPTDKKLDSRRIWGRGFRDGLRAAGITKEELTMQAAKALRLEREISPMARKVLGATPIGQPWTVADIITELGRTTHTHPDHKTVAGCLNSLVDDGLVKEVHKGQFMRVRVKQPGDDQPTLIHSVAPKKQEEPQVPIIEVKGQPSQEPLEMLANLGQQMRSIAMACNKLAEQCDDIGLAVEGRMQKMGQDSEYLTKLRTVLQQAMGGPNG